LRNFPLALAVAGSLIVPFASSVSASEPALRAVVLGIAQDGGVPHIGCEQELCVSARRDSARRQRVASLGLVDERASARFVIDATPDFASQLDSLNEGRVLKDRRKPVDGILLTHAHIGHYTGLMYLGREALGASGVPVYATPRMGRFLRENGPWSQLVSLGNIVLREIEPGRKFALTPDLEVTALVVPHRDEFSDTVGYLVRSPSGSLLYLPDIDKWEKWGWAIEDVVAQVDAAFLDATFFSLEELPGRSQGEVPHPLVGETMQRLARLAPRVRFLHVNHTNRLLFDAVAQREVESRGFRVAHDGDVLPLAPAP